MNYSELSNQIINDKITMVSKERFDMIINHYDNIKNLSGDIVECGAWAGGMSIFLSKLFNLKNIWVSDSYEGFQNPSDGTYLYPAERHTAGGYSYSLENTKNNFIKYDALDETRVFFLKGFVKDTLDPKICHIQTISLLRVDVDAYSATLEVLDSLYDKVVEGGYIIFDDTCLYETHDAIKTFFKKINREDVYVYDPYDNKLNVFEESNLPCGCYIRK